MTSHPPDVGIAMAMIPLIARGREALADYISKSTTTWKPLGGIAAVNSVDVVTEADLATHCILCIRHVTRNGCTLHLLCADGAICALLERVNGKH